MDNTAAGATGSTDYVWLVAGEIVSFFCSFICIDKIYTHVTQG